MIAISLLLALDNTLYHALSCLYLFVHITTIVLAEVYGKGAPGLKKDDFAAFEYGTRASFAGDEEHVDLSFRKIHIEL